MPAFPLHVYNEWHHDNGFHMSGDVYLTAQGQLRADLSTSTNSWGLGFTGGAIVPVIDANGNILHKWLIWPLGVDAKSIWWKRSSRTDHLEEQIDPGAAQHAEHVELWLGHMPKERWDDILNEISDKAEDLRKLYKDIMSCL